MTTIVKNRDTIDIAGQYCSFILVFYQKEGDKKSKGNVVNMKPGLSNACFKIRRMYLIHT